MLSEILRSQGVYVQRERLRDSIHQTDPVNTALRWHQLVRRRPYSVRGPNSLWHIDGKHKLICWRLVIHGGIEGFSHLVVYLHCSSNNKATTVIDLFTGAVQQHSQHHVYEVITGEKCASSSGHASGQGIE